MKSMKKSLFLNNRHKKKEGLILPGLEAPGPVLIQVRKDK